MTKVILGIIRWYRKTSPIFPLLSSLGILSPQCRYQPTCSHYAEMAILKFGIVKGGYLALKRFIKCNPFSKGGVDFP